MTTISKPRRLQSLPSRLAPLAPRIEASVSVGSWRSGKGSSTQRGYGYRWQQARAGHLRSHPWCCMCLAEMGLPAVLRADDAERVAARANEMGRLMPFASVVDHSVPHRGDMAVFWDRSLWQSLCAPHHSSDAQRRDHAAARGAAPTP